MVIQTISHSYEILRVLRRMPDIETAICRTIDSGEQQMLVTLKDPQEIRHMLPYFTALRHNTAFTDFQDCFAQEGRAYLVFADKERLTLTQQLERNPYTLPERIAIMKSLLSRMTLQDMPPEVQNEALKPENLQVDNSLTVYFRYDLSEISSYDTMAPRAYQERLAWILHALFPYELEQQVCEALNQLEDGLARRKYPEYLTIYRLFDEASRFLLHHSAAGTLQPHSRPFRIWERIKSWVRFVKPVAAGLVLLLLILYLLYTVVHPTVSVRSELQPPIHKIGTVSVE